MVGMIDCKNGVWMLMMAFPEVLQVPQVLRASQCDASVETFSDPTFCSHPLSESSSDPISSSATSIKLPISRRVDSLLGPSDLTFGPLEPDHLEFSPALVGLTNRGEGHFQSIIPALLPPLEDTDIRPPDQPSHLITPTPKILHNRTGYFGQDALQKLKQKRPVRSTRVSTASAPHPSKGDARWMASHHDIAAHHVAVVDHPGNVKGRDNTEIGFVADLGSFYSRWTSHLCCFSHT